MKIRLLKPYSGNDKGQVINVSSSIGNRLIAEDVAIRAQIRDFIVPHVFNNKIVKK